MNNQGPIFMVVANKSDLAGEREVTEEEGPNLARSLGCDFREMSAKSNRCVQELFESLVGSMHDSKQGSGRRLAPAPTHTSKEENGPRQPPKARDKLRGCGLPGCLIM